MSAAAVKSFESKILRPAVPPVYRGNPCFGNNGIGGRCAAAKRYYADRSARHCFSPVPQDTMSPNRYHVATRYSLAAPPSCRPRHCLTIATYPGILPTVRSNVATRHRARRSAPTSSIGAAEPNEISTSKQSIKHMGIDADKKL